MNSLEITYTKLILNHNYEKAIEISKQRIRLANKFCGGGFIAKATLVNIAFLYANIGKKEKVEELFKSSEGILNKYTSLRERVSMWLQKSEYYLFVEDTTNAEIYCQKVIDWGENRKLAKSSDTYLFNRALVQKALVQDLKGNYQAFISESSSAKKAFQNLIEKKFRDNWGKKLILAILVKLFLFPLIIMLPFLALIFPILMTREFGIFIVAFYVVSEIIIEPFLEKIIKSNDDKMLSIREYFLLIQKEGKFYEYLGDYDLARARYNEALQGLSTFYQDLSTSLNKEYTISKELILARSFVYLGSLTITISSQKTVSLDDKLSYYSNAISDYDKALAIYNSVNLNAENLIHQDYRADVITCLIEKCLAYVKLVGISVAEAEVLQTFPSIENLLIYPTHYTQYAGGLIELGSLYYCDHNYSRAEEYYSKAEQILKQYLGSSNENILWRSRLDFAWASLYIMTQRLDKALMRLKQSNKTSATILLQLLSVASDKHRMYALQSDRIFFNCYATLVCKHFFNDHSAVGSLFDSALQHKAIGSEILSIQRDVLLVNHYPPQKQKELETKQENLSNLRREISHKAFEAFTSDDLADFQRLNRKREALEEELAREIPELNIERNLKAVDRQIVSQALPSRSVLIEIVLVDFVEFSNLTYQDQNNPSNSAHYLAFVLHAGQPDKFHLIDLGSVEIIDQLLAKFRAHITGNFDDKSIDQAANRHLKIPYSAAKSSNKSSQSKDVGIALRNKIFDPLVTAIGERNKLFISPDGNLTQIPFEILPTDNHKQLIDLYSISYLSAGRDVLRFSHNSVRQGTAPIVIADPDFDYSFHSPSDLSSPTTDFSTRQSRNLNLSHVNFVRLPGMLEEGEIVSGILNAKKWMGEKATKKQIFKFLHSPLILHIVTHGFFLPNQKQNSVHEQFLSTTSQSLSFYTENPLLRSCLALAGANWKSKKFASHPDAGNGILTAEEVSSLDLSATELVVLSACETGIGDTLAGEGVFGLRRAFVLAGANTLVMSLWQVPDEQTKELMVTFYNLILSGESRSEALRKAQLKIREKNPNPYFWGAFICQGYTGKLPNLSNS
jgi:CHAT domain-containing protein